MAALVVFAMLTLGAVTEARADVWARIDERGVAHFAAERLDDRYELFLRGADRLGVLPAAIPAEPQASGAVVEAAADRAAATDEGSPTRLRRWLASSAAVQRTEPLLREVAQQHRLDAELLKAVVAAESGFDPQAVSPKGAVGLMQVMPATAQRYGVQPLGRMPVAQRLTDPQLNLHTGARYLRDLLQRFEGRLELALAAYNAGEGAVERHGLNIPPFPETQSYVRTVMQVYRSLRPQAPAARADRLEAAAVLAVPEPIARDATPPGGAAGRRNMIAPLTGVR